MAAPAPRLSSLARQTGALAVGALAGYVCALVHTPIPWMLGPLFSVAFLRMGGVDIVAPRPSRYVGQWVIGTSLGLYFTPYAMGEVGGVWWMLVAGAVFALGLGYVSGVVLARIARIDKTTGFFASVPGGAAEMATLGERFGARVDRVAAAQSFRILIVVAIVPTVITALGIQGTDRYAQGATHFDVRGFLSLMALTLAGCALFQWFRVPNAFVLGSLAVAIPLTAAEIDLSAMPSEVANAGQWLLGCALGSRFERNFLRDAHRFMGAVALTVVLSIVLSALFGIGLAWASGLHPATVVLGNAPGGIAEMCITAKVLQLGVPLVTAFHVTRLVVLLLVTPVVFARVRRWYRGRGGR